MNLTWTSSLVDVTSAKSRGEVERPQSTPRDFIDQVAGAGLVNSLALETSLLPNIYRLGSVVANSRQAVMPLLQAVKPLCPWCMLLRRQAIVRTCLDNRIIFDAGWRRCCVAWRRLWTIFSSMLQRGAGACQAVPKSCQAVELKAIGC